MNADCLRESFNIDSEVNRLPGSSILQCSWCEVEWYDLPGSHGGGQMACFYRFSLDYGTANRHHALMSEILDPPG